MASERSPSAGHPLSKPVSKTSSRPIALPLSKPQLSNVTILGRVSDVHFTILHAMLMPSSEGARYDIMPVLCPRCHTDQVMKGGKTTVHI